LLDLVRAPSHTPPSAHVPDIPPALDRIVLDALSVDPSRRPATALDFRSRLAGAVPGALSLGATDLASLLRVILPDALAASSAFLKANAPDVIASNASSSAEPATATGALKLARAPSTAGETTATLDALTVIGAYFPTEVEDSESDEAPRAIVAPARERRDDTPRRRMLKWASGAAALVVVTGLALGLAFASIRTRHAAPVATQRHAPTELPVIATPTVAPLRVIAPVPPEPVNAVTPVVSAPVPSASRHTTRASRHTSRNATRATHEVQTPTIRHADDGRGLAVPITPDIGM
jgi:serine/threonine-protein kinase